jgi:beta-aspartyl-peptidase (threonine type)
MTNQRPVILVHGGAGEWRLERQEAGIIGVERAAEQGFNLLEQGESAVNAVESAVMLMEDDETFNAGLGSSLNFRKSVEMEASIMDGKSLSAGATGLLNDIKNPIHLARIIMEKTDHIFVVGESAYYLAQAFNLEHRESKTKLREKYWNELRKKMEKNELNYLPKLSSLIKQYPHLFSFDTVGAVALDKNGNLAAGTSTGGITMKIPGRIGDSPLIGSGNYADNEAGACSATGIGEVAIRLVIAKATCEIMKNGEIPQRAAERIINDVNRRIKTNLNHMGIIAIDRHGQIGAAHNTRNMCWAYMTPQMNKPKAFLKAKTI